MLKLVTVLTAFAVPLVASAHHSFAMYSDEIAEIDGELISVRWGNPHVRLTLKAADGTNENWTLEAAAVYVLERRGLTEDLFQPGQRIKVAGRLRTGRRNEIWLHNMLLGDGRELLMIGGVDRRWTATALGGDGSQSVVDTVSQDRGMFRVWSQPLLRPIDFGEGLPYREAPSTGGSEWIERLDGFAARCEPVGMPGVMATPYPFQFIDHGSWIQLLGFSNNALVDRAFHLNGETDAVSGEADPANPVPGRFGFSVGRWESAQRLVVETTRIDWPYFDDSLGTPQSDRIETVEVFTLSDDQSRLDYEMIVTDPATFAAPTTAIKTHRLAFGETVEAPSYCADQTDTQATN